LLLRRGTAPTAWFGLLLAMLGFAISIGVDTIYIRDHLAGDPANPGDWYRMNTVFKFGMQIWLVLALAAATLLPVLLRRLNGVAAGALLLVLAGVAALALVFPLVGTPSRVAYRFPDSPAPTLDGLRFLDTASYEWNGNQIDLRDDGEAIRWLNANITGTPVVLQSSAEFYRAYGVRIAANTGLPTVVSPLHESEQRDGDLVAARDRDVITFYQTANPDEALRILSKYRVGYVYVGQIERAVYGEQGMAKFDQLAGAYLEPVFSNASATVYQVDQGVYNIVASGEKGEVVVIDPVPQPAAPQPADQAGTANPPGQPSLAELEAENAAAPSAAGFAFSLGQRYHDLNRPEDAARVLAAAAAANPGDVPLHHLWGDMLRDAGRPEDAEFAYTLAAQAQPTAGNYNKLGTEMLLLNRLDAAEAALNEAQRLDPQLAEPYYRLGQLYERLQQSERARENYDRYLELEPNGPYRQQAGG
ncbi:MAG: tetratricopeptide repeat protein, partial [Roseiflexaceae bacterium]|nr:tetratricopeptide repeat protein [Roseiflexaceae bacterium]